MVYYVMNSNGKVICRSTVTQLEPSDHDVTEYKIRMKKLDNAIETSIGDYRNATNLSSSDIPDMDDNVIWMIN